MENLFTDLLIGEVNENKLYYTEEMLTAEMGQLALYIMNKKGLLTTEEFRQFKNEWVAMRNKQIIDELKKED